MVREGVINFQGAIALVTGAASGLGLAYARELLERDARVLLVDTSPGVCDVASSLGAGSDAALADVSDIDACRAAVEKALSKWGRVDILINNAGMLRDHTIEKQLYPEWSSILDVHLTGTRNMTVASWNALKANRAGSVVNTTSASGLYGNFGQTNYCAAKMGVVGFTKACASEGVRHGIRVNCIAPIAHTNMTDSLWQSEESKARTSPHLISPVVAYLASSHCRVTGKVVAAGGGYVARVAVVEGQGVRVGLDDTLDVEWVERNFDLAMAISEWTEPASVEFSLERAFGLS